MPVDPRHLRNIPTGAPLARTIARVLARQHHDALHAIRTHQPLNLSRWTDTLAKLATPHIHHYVGDGGRDAERRIRQMVRRGPTGRKNYPASSTFAMGAFDLFNPRVLDAIQAAVLQFAASTNATSQLDVDTARAETRRMLSEGMSAGDAAVALERRLATIFSRDRAKVIGRTEASRAIHGGQVLAAQESGIVKKTEWLTSSAPCPECEALNGKQVPLGEPFSTEGGHGPYRLVFHPPLHPHCVCTILEVIDWDAVASAQRMAA